MKKIRAASLTMILIIYFPLIQSAQQLDIHKRPRQYERSREYGAMHYRLELAFDLDEKSFWGTNARSLTPLKNEFTPCVVDAEELIVDDVKNPEGTPLEFEQTDRHLIIHFPKAHKYGKEVLFTVEYHAIDPKRGLYFDEETEKHPQMVTTVSWPEYAHHWLPCYDYPNDKVTHEFIITVKDTLKVLGYGRLVRVMEDKLKGTKTFRWSRLRTAALQVLGEYGRADLVPFFMDRFDKDDSYLAQAEALRSIGKCGNQTHLSFLEDAVEMKSYRNVIARAAESAITVIKQRNH